MNERNFSFYRQQLAEENWQSERGKLPSEVAQWLLHQGSLTEKLKSICHCFQVEVIREQWQIFEKEGTEISTWLREVMLKCGESDWIFAQTLLPQSTVESVGKPVLAMGENAIGLWLFPQNPVRISLQWQKINGLYARRAVYDLQGFPIEIRELFLMNFPFKDHDETNNSAL